MNSAKGIWFVYRSPDEGPLSKRVCRVEAPSILAWFQEKIADARSAAAPRTVADADLGGSVHGFGSLLVAAKEHKLAAPKSTTALRAMLLKHLDVGVERPRDAEGRIRLDDHTLRVITRHDEVMRAYYFFDDEAVREHAESIAWLLEEDPRLVDGAEDGPPFVPSLPVPTLEPAGSGEGVTYACLMTSHGGESIPGTVGVFPGVRLPDLAAHLRLVVPPARPKSWSPEVLDTWPLELRLLRALVDEGDATLAPALRRCAGIPLGPLAARADQSRLGVGAHAEARAEFDAALTGTLTGASAEAPDGDTGGTIVHEGEHVAILCARGGSAGSRPGFQQWVFFDDRWAAAYPDFAGSLLRYATDWDPFPWEYEESPMSAATVAARKHETAWESALEGRGPTDARRYRPAERFAAGELIDHAKFGLGIVRRAEASKIDVLFRDALRTLAQGT